MAFTQIQQGGAAATSKAFVSDNTAGNLLVCVIGSGGDITNVTDTAGNTWVKAADVGDAGLLLYGDIWYVASCVGGANTVSLSGGFGGGFDGIWVGEYSHAGSASLDQTNTGAGNTGLFEQPDSGDVTTTADDELLIGAAMSDAGSAPSMTWDAPWSELYDQMGHTRGPTVAERIVSAIGTYSATGTHSGASSSWRCLIVTFKDGGGGGGGLSIPIAMYHYKRMAGAN